MDLMTVDLRLVVTDHPPLRAEAPVKIHCREQTHEDHEQSMCVYAGGVKCFGCGFVVSRRMEALAYLLYGDQTRWREAIKEAGHYVGNQDERVQSQAPVSPLPHGLAELYYDNLYLHRRHRVCWYEQERGLSRTTIYRYCLGHDGSRFTIPVYDREGTLLAIRFRRDDYYAMGKPGPKYSGTSGHNGAVLFPCDALSPTCGETLAIVEGEFDAIRAGQAGIPTVTITNGASNMSRIPAMIEQACPWVKNLVIIGDMDEPGRDAAANTGYEAVARGYKIQMLCWNQADGKDVTEYCLNTNEARLKVLWKKLIATFTSASTS